MPNRLARETSPYLLQHADNPVDWYPWGDEALTRARAEDKPILLSIGYSSCHWCHVMAHESFEDGEVAEVMNRLFINIKVDREERPDLDQIYQTAHQLLAGRGGGWPLTVFLSPDQVPFFAGTYFPKTARFGLPGFVDLLEHIARAWRQRRAEIEAQNAALLDALAVDEALAPPAADLNAAPIQAAIADIKQGYDPVHGGYGRAPKFPRPVDLAFLLHSGDAEAGEQVLTTLRNMAERGLMDQLGGGFYRYSVDERWAIPHFEKMLYDNGPAGGGPLSAGGRADAHTQPCGAVTTSSGLREPADRTGRLPGSPAHRRAARAQGRTHGVAATPAAGLPRCRPVSRHPRRCHRTAGCSGQTGTIVRQCACLYWR